MAAEPMATPAQWPLLARFPPLTALQPVPLCNLPTPVSAFSARLWVKHDDTTRDDQGGNKARKLEFVLADIRRRRARRVITFGATGTNAGVATALLCQREKLHCEIITFPQPDSPVVAHNQAVMHHCGARLHARQSLWQAALSWYLHPRRLNPKSYFLYAGCSAPVATFAYVNALLELHQQIALGELPTPEHIVVAAGSGATVAGLLVGAALVLPDTRVHAIQVAPARVGPFLACHPDAVRKMAQIAWRQLRACDSSLPAQLADQLQWHDQWLGAGYGVSSGAAEQAMATGACQQLVLEGTYSGKAFAAALAISAECTAPTLFWQTFSPARLPEQGPSASSAALPGSGIG